MSEQELARLLANDPRQVVVVTGAGVTLGALEHGTDAFTRASWRGLIEHGLAFATEQRALAEVDAQKLRALLDSDRASLWIAAAECMSQALGAPRGGDFAAWLHCSVGDLAGAIRPGEVLEVLVELEQRGAILATVNYDGVLEAVTGLPPVTWREPTKVQRLLRGDTRGILHLHGHWEDPASVVLGSSSYAAVLSDRQARAALTSMAMMRTFVFVGHGAGLDDPNWSSLLDWMAEVLVDSPYRHYRIVREVDRAAFEDPRLQARRIGLVPFGGDHDGLGPFLWGLLGRSLDRSPEVAKSTAVGMPPVPAAAPPMRDGSMRDGSMRDGPPRGMERSLAPGEGLRAKTAPERRASAEPQEERSNGLRAETRSGSPPVQVEQPPERRRADERWMDDEPAAAPLVHPVLMLLNIGGHDHDAITAEQALRAAEIDHVAATLELTVSLEPSEASSQDWRAVRAKLDAMVEQAQAIRTEPPCVLLAGRAPLPVFAYLGYRTQRLTGEVLMVGHHGGQWHRIGPFGGPQQFPVGAANRFTLLEPASDGVGPGKNAVFVGCSAAYRCSLNDLRPVVGPEPERTTALCTVQSKKDHLLDPMTEDDLAPLSELFHVALRVLTDTAPRGQGLVFAFGGPAWVAFWLGRQLNRKVVGEIDFPNFVPGRGYVPALDTRVG